MSLDKDYNIEETDLLVGDQPFRYRFVRLASKAEDSITEVVEDSDGFKEFVREIRFIDENHTTMSEEEAEFICKSHIACLPKVYGLFEGTVDGKRVRSVVKEIVEGETLEDVVSESGVIKPKDAVEYARQALSTLQHIHEAGFTTRDINPANLILVEEEESQTKRVQLGRLSSLTRKAGEEDEEVEHDGWTYPDEHQPAGEIEKDLFSVGTTLYYLVTGEKPQIVSTRKGVTLDDDDFRRMDKKFSDVEGGPELIRTIRKLTSPSKKKRFRSAEAALEDAEELNRVFADSYRALQNKKFQIHRESGLTQIKNGVYSLGSSAGDLISGITDGVGSLLRAVTGSPLSIGCTAGVLLAPIGYFATGSYLKGEVSGRPIYFSHKMTADGPAIIKVSAGLNDVASATRGIFVRLNGETAESFNAITLLDDVQSVQTRLAEIVSNIAVAKSDVSRFDDSLAAITRGGSKIKRSFTHKAEDNDDDCYTDDEGERHCSYSDTDHWWKFFPSKTNEGIQQLNEGLEKLGLVEVATIDLSPYSRSTPARDDLGRAVRIDNPREGVNEWLAKGLAGSYNHLNTSSMLLQSGEIRQLNVDFEQDLFNNPRRAYPAKKHVNNECRKGRGRCDEVNAPEGYVLTKRVGGLTNKYGRHYQRINTVLSRGEAGLKKLDTELAQLAARLQGGEQLEAEDFTKAVDISAAAYKRMVPGSNISAPSLAEQSFWPLAVGGATFLGLAGLGLGLQIYNSRSRSRYSSFNDFGGGFGGGFGRRSRRKYRGW